MLWYKSWLDTRWRFLTGLALLSILACGIVFEYVQVLRILPTVGTPPDASGLVGRAINEAIALERTYRGFIWLQWFRQNLMQMGTLFAALLGSGSPLSGSSGGALFTLSLPASRTRWLGVRAATGLAEFFVLAVVPSLVIPLLSPVIGQHYSVVDAVVHSTCLFIGGSAFFSLAFLLSTVFGDLWRPLLIACTAAVMLGLCEQYLFGLSSYGIFGAISAATYFRTGALPWPGLLASVAASAAMLYAADRNIARQDF